MYFPPDKLEYKRDANMLKGGLVYADYITTVSQKLMHRRFRHRNMAKDWMDFFLQDTWI